MATFNHIQLPYETLLSILSKRLSNKTITLTTTVEYTFINKLHYIFSKNISFTIQFAYMVIYHG